MRRTSFDLVKSGLGIGILVVALCFQMLPFFLLVVVMAHALGVSGGGMLVIVPVLFLVMVLAACWRASQRTRLVAAWKPPRERRTLTRPGRGHAQLLMKTRAERYQDLKDIMKGDWR